MSFSELTTPLQTIILENYGYTTKWLIFLLLITLSYYYIFVSWKNHKPSHFYTVVVLRILYLGLSFAYLIFSPFTLLLMTPEYSLYDFYGWHLIFYVIFLSIGGITLFIDFMRYGIIGIIKLAGIQIKDEGSNVITNALRNNKHFLKFAKSKGGKIGK